jgi:crotonobetaine/carnitine-CoA ligase
MWDQAVADHANALFLIFRSAAGATNRWTYRDFDEAVARVAGMLRSTGVGRGDAVHIVLRNSPGFIAAWLAIARLGAWMVPVDPASSARDISHQVRRVRPTVALIAADNDDGRSTTYRQGADGRVARIIELAEDASDLRPGSPLVEARPLRDQASACDDRLAVMFTSGTTSEPKGVELTQACYAHVATAMAKAAGLRSRHRWFVTLPLFHANAQYYCFAPAVAVGASVAMTASFSASRWMSQARELEVTHASLFAAPIRMILARRPPDEEPLALEHVWFAQSLARGHHQEFAALAGVPPRQLYGMTETVSVVTYDHAEEPRHDVIGSPLAGRTIRVVDPATGGEAEPGRPGELVVRGVRGRDLCVGYLEAPDLNARAFEKDHVSGVAWFHTGDLVSVDAHGMLRFVGRVDDVIKVAGENVSLTEVEAALAQAPGVLEVAVVSQADPIRDQVPVAYVVAKNKSSPPHADALDAWARNNLPPAARPRAWHMIDELPRTSVGKVRRFQVDQLTR